MSLLYVFNVFTPSWSFKIFNTWTMKKFSFDHQNSLPSTLVSYFLFERRLNLLCPAFILDKLKSKYKEIFFLIGLRLWLTAENQKFLCFDMKQICHLSYKKMYLNHMAAIKHVWT